MTPSLSEEWECQESAVFILGPVTVFQASAECAAERGLGLAISKLYLDGVDSGVASQPARGILLIRGVLGKGKGLRNVSSDISRSRRNGQNPERQDKRHEEGKNSRGEMLSHGGVCPSGFSSHLVKFLLYR